MTISINPDTCPRFCLAGQKIEIDKADCSVNSLTVQELKLLILYWFYSALENLQEPPELSPGYFTRNMASKALGVSLPTFDKMIREGKLPTRKIGRRYAILPEDVNALLTQK